MRSFSSVRHGSSKQSILDAEGFFPPPPPKSIGVTSFLSYIRIMKCLNQNCLSCSVQEWFYVIRSLKTVLSQREHTGWQESFVCQNLAGALCSKVASHRTAGLSNVINLTLTPFMTLSPELYLSSEESSAHVLLTNTLIIQSCFLLCIAINIQSPVLC